MRRPRLSSLSPRICAASLLASGLAPCIAWAGDSMAASAAGALSEPWPGGWSRALDAVVTLWTDGVRRHPALMAGVTGIMVIPVLVMLGVVLRGFQAGNGQPMLPAMPSDPPRVAWLELDDVTGRRMPVDGELIQIGREDDNDLSIDDASVHRYHAVIERSHDVGFIITDLSGPDGNGVRVNGERLLKSSLAHGDLVEIGCARLKFATVL